MNTLDTLFFPDTSPLARHRLPFLLLFNSLHLLEVVESEGEDLPEPDTFMEKGFCQVHSPVPLGEDRTRFLHLIDDIKNRKDSYASQLSSLTLASLSNQSTSDSSKQAILSSLMGNDQSSDTPEEKEREKLWQARLILKIGEILDQEEEELNKHLAAIDSSEIEMFHRLQGRLDQDDASEDPFNEILALREKMSRPRPSMIKKRFNAWNRLLQTTSLADNFALWSSHRSEAVDLLFEQYEKKTNREPALLLQLPLPEKLSSDLDSSIDQIDSFRKEHQSMLIEISEALYKLACSGEILLAEPSQLLAKAFEWQRQFSDEIDYHFPEERHGKTTLNIYLLANIPLSQLYNRKEPVSETTLRHGLLAVNTPL